MSDPYDPQIAAANRRLGLLLGAAVLAVVLIFMWRFTRNGLPEDGAMHAQLEQQAAARAAQQDDAAPPALPTEVQP